MNTFEAIKLLMEQDIRADFGEIHNHESVAEHLAGRIDDLWNENEKLKARNEQMEAALREIEYLDSPLVRGKPRRVEIYDIARAALGEKKDDK